MTKKDIFIKLVENEIFSNDFRNRFKDVFSEEELDMAESYWEDFRKGASKNAKEMTENGYKILSYMQQEATDKNILEFTSNKIGEALNISGRSAAGSIRKLVTDGYVNKKREASFCVYSLTDKGLNYIQE